MVSLDKTPQTISLGRMRAAINAGLRKNNLLALHLELSERAHEAKVKAEEEYRRSVLEADVCNNDRCYTPTRAHEDFCSEGCWEWWHATYDPEVLERATPRS